MNINFNDVFIVLFGYLLGSINFAIIISKASGKKALVLLTNDGKVSAYGSGSRFGLVHPKREPEP